MTVNTHDNQVGIVTNGGIHDCVGDRCAVGLKLFNVHRGSMACQMESDVGPGFFSMPAGISVRIDNEDFDEFGL